MEEKQRASIAFTKLLSAMETLGFSPGEQKAIWHVLAGIYHLGAAGACKGNIVIHCESHSVTTHTHTLIHTHLLSVAQEVEPWEGCSFDPWLGQDTDPKTQSDSL